MPLTNIALVGFSIILAGAWIPVAIYFWKAWKFRGSPLSLAICGLVGYPIFTNANSVIFLFQDQEVSVRLLVGANFLLLINFAICFKWQKDRFPEERSQSSRGSKSIPPPPITL